MLTLALALMLAATPPGESMPTGGARMGLVTGGAGPGSTSSSPRPGLVGVGSVGTIPTPEPPAVSDKTVTVIFSFAAATAIAGFTLWLLSPLDADEEDPEEGGLDVIPLLGVDEGAAVSAGLRLGF